MAGLKRSSIDGRAGSGFLGSGHAEASALMIVRRADPVLLLDRAAGRSRTGIQADRGV
jgi:hypothetical protein